MYIFLLLRHTLIVQQQESVVNKAQELQESFNETALGEELQNECGRDFTDLYQSIIAVENAVKQLFRTMLKLLELIRCDSIVPIYQQVVYTGTCHYSVKAVIWMFSAALVTSLVGLLIITFRSALYPTVYTDVYYGSSSLVENEKERVFDDRQLDKSTLEL
jgi:hypothetical protein